MSPDEVRRVVGDAISQAEAEALAEWYANVSRGVSAFPQAELKGIEPPLRSIPGPSR